MKPIWTILLCLALLSLPCEGWAGAWPKGKGNSFTSTSASLTWPNGRAFEYPDVYGSLYIEHGLSPRLTLGLDLGSPDYTRRSRLKAIAFLNFSLSRPESRHQFALNLGAGQYLGAPNIRVGAAYGAGVNLFGQSGWVSLEAHALFAPQSRQHTISADATLGLSFERSKLLAQLSVFRAQDGRVSKGFTPSYVRQIAPGRHFELGVRFDLQGKADPALKLGIWQEF